ncbi:heat shock 70 kDa protein 12A-like [Astyanax mexicanus]|uniref:heat shock 70 kDa protein 12A-like n=1 Tax=Astyanax mexicanus TaxID=7994 RepID=UPI0020CB066D|nr:heat shock 70 kDa protein 12A-like [Astyanax mexicanus]
MGKEVDLTLGSSGVLSEDFTNPYKESELKIMYEKLRINEWANLVPKLRKGGSGMSAKDLRIKAEQVIRDGLRQSQEDTQKVIKTTEALALGSQERSSKTKTAQYFESAIQNLQLAVYHEKVGIYNTQKLQDIPEVLRPMFEDCYKIGCLMALHNPPVLLNFDNSGQGPFPPIKTECSSTDEEMADHRVFIAVDLGMDFSGYCFKIAESEQIQQPKWGKEFGFNTPKTPTCILFDGDQKFFKFGYDAIMTKKDEAKQLYLFDNFKMELHKNKLHRDVMLTSKNGKKMRAMTVFSESLRFMKDHALETIGKHTAGVKYSASDATWILTVPAIWSAAAKQFMREAATEAGLVTESEPDRLIIALEHEAASVWCKQLTHKQFMEEDLTEAEAIMKVPGTQYMVADCGGVNINITVHEVMEGGHLKELNWATKTFVDPKPIDKHFKECLRETFYEKMCDALEEKHPSDLQKLMYDYNGDFKFLSNLEQLVRKVEEKGASSRGSPETQRRILQIGDKLKLLHDNRIRSIESLIREILTGRKISYMFLVGGFALSPYVYSFVKEKFEGRCKVLCPADAQMAVLNGAVTFGMRQNVVESRISRYTYGIKIVEEFDQTRHRGKRKYVTKEGKAYCNDCFHCFVKKNESVSFDEVSEFDFNPVERDQKHVQFDLYYTESKSARFVDEPGMVKIGSLAVSMPGIKSGSPRTLKLQVKVGCPEMQVTFIDVNTGEIGSVKLALMSK